jgi:hypothetical protein
MVTYKDTEKKTTSPKRNIKIEGVRVDGDYLTDECGNIASAVKEVLPPGVEEFTIKITLELPEEEEPNE